MHFSCMEDDAAILSMDKVSHLTVFLAWYGNPYLLVTPAQLMRPDIGRNASSAESDFTTARPVFYQGDVICRLLLQPVTEIPYLAS